MSNSEQQNTSSPICLYGGGPLFGCTKNITGYPTQALMREAMDNIKNSDFTTVTLWSLGPDVHQPKIPSPPAEQFNPGDLYMYVPLVTSDTQGGDSEYIGPDFLQQELHYLKHHSKVDRVLFCLGVNWPYLKENPSVLEPGAPVYNNFVELKRAIPALDGIDFDFEGADGTNSDFHGYVETIVGTSEMLKDIGYQQVTFCPGQQGDNPGPSVEFWSECWSKVDQSFVTGINLQCYGAEGLRSTRGTGKWITEFDGPRDIIFPIAACYGANPAGLSGPPSPSNPQGLCPEDVEKFFSRFQRKYGSRGGSIWLYDAIKYNQTGGGCSGPMGPDAYAEAIVQGLQG